MTNQAKNDPRTPNPELRTLIESLSDPTLPLALDLNVIEYWRVYGRAPGRRLLDDPRRTVFLTGLPTALFNGVLRVEFSDETADAGIADTLGAIQSSGVPFWWWVGTATAPSDIGDRLPRFGLIPSGNYPCMALDMNGLADEGDPPELEIRRVEHIEDLVPWAETLAVGNALTPPLCRLLVELETGVGLAPHPGLLRYIGFWKGKPAATSSMLLHGGLAGVFAVATVPEARRRGFGTALTVAALRDARREGFRIAVLQATTMGQPVYEKLGFVEVCRVASYLGRPGDLSLEPKP